jgi:hypothetical protein
MRLCSWRCNGVYRRSERDWKAVYASWKEGNVKEERE